MMKITHDNTYIESNKKLKDAKMDEQMNESFSWLIFCHGREKALEMLKD